MHPIILLLAVTVISLATYEFVSLMIYLVTGAPR